MSDISDLFASETPVSFGFENPVTFEPLLNGEGKPMTVDLWSGDSEAARAAEKIISNDMLERVARTRGGRFKMDAALSDSYAKRRFVSRIAGWANWTLNGKPFECTPETKEAVFSEPKFGVLRRQIEAHMGDESGFLATTSTKA
jgi:hypothetical protein